LVVWKKLQEAVVPEKDCHTCRKFQTYADILTDFLAKEMILLAGRDKCLDIFRDIDLYRDDFEKLHKQMNNFIQYKFLRVRNELTYNRLDLISRTGFLHGPQYIVCILKKY